MSRSAVWPGPDYSIAAAAPPTTLASAGDCVSAWIACSSACSGCSSEADRFDPPGDGDCVPWNEPGDGPEEKPEVGPGELIGMPPGSGVPVYDPPVSGPPPPESRRVWQPPDT